MRVRCSRLVNAHGEPVESSSSLTVGKEYVVLEITAATGRYVHLRLMDDAETPSLWPVEIFEVTSAALASNWTASIDEATLSLLPASWSEPGFWERYFDDDRAAIEQFEYERRIILEED